MKEFIAKFTFVCVDILIIFISLILAYLLRNLIVNIFGGTDSYPLINYTSFYPLYAIVIALFFYEGIYTYRYDFWHESRLVLKAIIFSAFIVFAYLAITKSVENYSRLVIGLSFLMMTILIPLSKNICKKLLFKLGLWQKKANIYGHDPFLRNEIYGNPYLGYIEAQSNEEPSTVFINSKDHNVIRLKKIISSQIQHKHEVIFIPLIDEYDLTHSHIYELSNTRTNLIVFKNRLKSNYRLIFKNISDMLLSLSIFPFLILIMLYIAYKIKRLEPEKSIFFTQKRLGKDGIPFACYKFRTMLEDGEKILNDYLKEHPEEIEYYNQYHKYINDPRITKIGHFLRRTSLDELPQIFNVFKREMSFIGPRPYMMDEKTKMGNDLETILAVRPGITGLWQVSGRSDVDFFSRIELDVWYLRNWNLWMDFVILIKTIKTVLLKDGAK